ncbi:uncharacterized protein LOC143237362 [Tachypleus tridentatus]|uniref:uncharacterized protein LOC143237362 n=1 Tax=Tachypleus tridentatus TaxID=6853 RepID=UPI003FD23CCA
MMIFPWRLSIVTFMLVQTYADNSFSPKQDITVLHPREFNDGQNPYNVITVARRQVEQIPEHLPKVSDAEPSCAELRAMWHNMRRIARHSEMTNEIPTIPFSFPTDILDYAMSQSSFFRKHEFPAPLSFPTTSNLRNVLLKSPIKGSTLNNPARKETFTNNLFSEGVSSHHHNNNQYYVNNGPQRDYSHGRIKSVNPPDRFSDIPFLEGSLGVFGTMVRSPEEKALLEKQQHLGKLSEQFVENGGFQPSRISNKDLGKGFGTFGAFASDMEQSNPSKNNFQFGTFVHDMSSTGQHSAEEEEKIIDSAGAFGGIVNPMDTCKNVETNPCRNDDDCFCFENVLRCVATKCQVQQSRSKSQVYTDNWGTWNSGPIDSTKLGISRKKRNSARVIAM